MLEKICNEFNAGQTGGKKLSLADLIVLAGGVGVEQAAQAAGHEVKVAFAPERMNASQEQTDVVSSTMLEPIAGGFRNYRKTRYSVPAKALLLDRAQLLTLTAPEMTVLVGGLRVLGANIGQAKDGVFTKKPGTLSNVFLSTCSTWEPSGRLLRATASSFRDLIARRVNSAGSAHALTWSSARTRSCAPLPRSTPAPTPGKSSPTISLPHGQK